MNLLNVNEVLTGIYLYGNKTEKPAADGAGFFEQMVNNPQKALYYENKIQMGLSNFPKVQAQLSLAGFEIYSYGVSIASDGTVYTYTCGDLKPEVRAKIEAKIKAEDEAKAERKREAEKRSEEAAKRRRQEMKLSVAAYEKGVMEAKEIYYAYTK